MSNRSSNSNISYLVARALFCLCLLFLTSKSFGQRADTSDKITIQIANTREIIHLRTDSGEYTKFVGDVVLYQGTDTLYCDSLYQNSTTQNFEAFGEVRIVQLGGTEGTCDYLRYKSATKLAFMQGNVRLTDKKSTLWCEELTYDLATKTAVYNKNGTLQTDSTTVSSTSGVYNVKSKDARFTGDVIVTDPKYKIRSEDLGYNAETKLSTFYSRSTVTSDSGKSVLQTTRGTYDGKNIIAHFTGPSSIWNDGQYIEADSMSYNKLTGLGMAHGNVVSIDTAQKSWLYCGHAEYYRLQRVLWATIKPVLVQANGKDTFYMRSDTFYSAPMEKVLTRRVIASKPVWDSVSKTPGKHLVKESTTLEGLQPLKDSSLTVEDTVQITWIVPPGKIRMPGRIDDAAKATAKKPGPDAAPKAVAKKGRLVKPSVGIRDTAQADTTAPSYFIGYHHALIFSDSLQAKCDSICYTRSDSLIRMIYAPIAWSRKSQITGDTILMKLDSSKIKYLFVPNNAFVVSQSGPVKAKLFDQVQGKTLTAYFDNNEVTSMVVFPNAEAIYYNKDEQGAYLGVGEFKSEKMFVFFDHQQISTIKYHKYPDFKLTPMTQADLPGMKLSRFKWLLDERPKSKEELFR
jgi:lipopolysaccharide export system protein LptA